MVNWNNVKVWLLMKRLSYNEFEEKLEEVKEIAQQSFLESMGIEDCPQSIHGLKHWKSVKQIVSY